MQEPVSAIESARTLWSVLAAIAGAAVAVGGWVWRLAVRYGRLQADREKDVERISRLEQNGSDFKGKVVALHERIDEHEALPGHPVGEERREQLTEQVAEMKADVRAIREASQRQEIAMAQLLSRVGGS